MSSPADPGSFETITLKTSGGQALIVPALGGMVHSLRLRVRPQDGVSEVLRGDSPEELFANPWFRGRILFPFNDRIPGGQYSFGGKTYRMESNADDGSAIHGFLYREGLTLIAQNADADGASLVLELEAERCHRPAYPWMIGFRVEYRLEGSSFLLRMTARNMGSDLAPLAFGWHPYFCLPGPLDAWHLTHPASHFVPVGSDLMPLGHHQAFGGQTSNWGQTSNPPDFRKGRALGNSELDIALLNPKSPGMSIVLTNWGQTSNGGQTLKITMDANIFRYTQLFIPPGRDSIAIEPVTAATNAFNLPALGLRVIEPGEEVTGTVRVECE